MARRAFATVALAAAVSNHAVAQIPVTRADAERAALAAGPRVALARADTAAARAAVLTARAWPNPNLSYLRSEAVPRNHLNLDFPLDAPWQRGPRVASANAARRASQLRFLSERTAALLEVDTTYTRALATDARLRLSRQTARDADSLRKMTIARRNAGDASDLDVDLATITAGQQTNLVSGDSLTRLSALLTVQTLMGIPADSVTIVLVDSLRLAPSALEEMIRSLDSSAAVIAPPPSLVTSPVTLPSSTPTAAPARPGAGAGAAAAPTAPASPTTTAGGTATSMLQQPAGPTPSVAAAEAAVQAAELAITRERRSVWGLPSITIGVEWGDESFDPPSKKLPLAGVAIPLPIFNRNQGGIALATAERDRALADLRLARLTARQRLREALRERELLRARISRDQEMVVRAERVATKSLTAYREGASALPAVLEARRTARDVLGQYIDDVAALLTLQAELRVLTMTVPPPQ
jgi:cobalt-zinc-cadmium efflux system outer membrane protein